MSATFIPLVSRQHGMALFEVLIACVICAFTLAAVIKMQSISLRQVSDAEHQFYLTYYVAELGQKIKNNHAFSSKYLGTFKAGKANVETPCKTLCSSADLVRQDLQFFLLLMQQRFKSFSITIRAISTQRYVIEVQWDSRWHKERTLKKFIYRIVL